MIRIPQKLVVKLAIGTLLAVLSAMPAFTQALSKTDGSKTFASKTKPVPATVKWILESGPPSNLKVTTPHKQFFCLEEHCHLATIENGKIEIYQYAVESQWTKVQTLEVPEVAFTTCIVKDLNNDRIPEIIGGTTEPGFIYIYYRNQDRQWITKSDAKYIWSTVVRMATFHVAGNPNPLLVVQNKEGFLYVLKPSDTALNLIWKSPAAWKPLDSLVAVDLDNNAGDELLVIYKNGGIAILRSVKNALQSVWEYFPWGKILTTGYHDWDHNNMAELILPTTQRMVCIIHAKNRSFQASQEPYDYVIEKIYFTKVHNQKMMITTDTSGKTHIAVYSAKGKHHWRENQIFQTGRILEICEKNPGELLLVNQGLQFITLKIEPDQPAPLTDKPAAVASDNQKNNAVTDRDRPQTK
jgi:hypothetical protein